MGGYFWVPKEIRSDGESQFTSKLSEELCEFGHKYFLVLFRPEANGFAEGRMAEVMKHPRA